VVVGSCKSEGMRTVATVTHGPRPHDIHVTAGCYPTQPIPLASPGRVGSTHVHHLVLVEFTRGGGELDRKVRHGRRGEEGEEGECEHCGVFT
jgi:hypothetical protein